MIDCNIFVLYRKHALECRYHASMYTMHINAYTHETFYVLYSGPQEGEREANYPRASSVKGPPYTQCLKVSRVSK